MINFTESRLQFSFDDTIWDVIMKVDGHVDQRKTQVLQRFKTADFLCGRQGEVLFIEVKNYSGYNTPVNTERLLNDIASKVKDTISCSVAANISSTTDQISWNYLVTQLSNQNVIIKVVFWMEESHPNVLRARAGASFYGNLLKKKLTWLTNGHNVLVANTNLGGINGLIVT